MIEKCEKWRKRKEERGDESSFLSEDEGGLDGEGGSSTTYIFDSLVTAIAAGKFSIRSLSWDSSYLIWN